MTKEFNLEICPLTELPISDNIAWFDRRKGNYSYYLQFRDKETYLEICPMLFKYLTDKLDPIDTKKFEEYDNLAHLFFGTIAKNNFQDFFGKKIHWNCNYKDSKDIDIKNIALKTIKDDNYPKSSKEKTLILLNIIKNNQNYSKIKNFNIRQFEFWSQCYFRNGKELNHYINQLVSQDLLQVQDNSVLLTLSGLDYLEERKNIINTSKIELGNIDLKEVENLKNEIKELVGKTKIDDSLKKCERLFNLIGKVNNSELIIIKSRQSKFKSDSVKGILSKEDEGLEYRKIVDLILKLLQLD